MRDAKTDNVKMVGGNAKREPQAGALFSVSSRVPTVLAVAGVDDPPRRKMVAEAAYYAAERRGFAAGSELADWLAAEREIDAKKNDAKKK